MPENKIVLYENESGNIEFRVDPENETIWATQDQISDAFDTTVPNINMHLKNIFNDGELAREATIKKSLTVQSRADAW